MRWMVFGFLLSLSGLLGQTTFQEQADRLQNINAYLLDFRPAAAPDVVEKLSFEGSFDLYPQPSINTRIGAKDEPLDPPSVVPKLRGRILLPQGWMLGGTYVPGITFQDYTADYVSLELGYRMRVRGWDFGLRASYGDGDVEGPITENEAKDEFTFTNVGFDFSIGKQFGQFKPYVFLGQNDIETELLIEEDGALLDNEDDAPYAGLGVTYIHGAWRLNFEQNFTDDYLAFISASVGYRF